MKNFIAAPPEFAAFGDWAKNAPWTDSYAEDRFNSLNSFVFVDNAGAEHVVRWSLLPAAQLVSTPIYNPCRPGKSTADIKPLSS